MQTSKYETVDATPVKSFFIEMLTRDIDLVDAILDLLDNCVDGILREKKNSSGKKPYVGLKADITFDENSFSISDNCGGIPWDLHEYAFRMGKEPKDRDPNLPTIGVYGIGMKRAIFKIGKRCLISTRNQEDCYEVEISPKWIEDPDKWELPVSESSRPDKEDGTTIVIDELNEGITTHFRERKEFFTLELTEKVKTHYAFILGKGFEVQINGKPVEAKPTRLVFNDKIKPYIYQTESDGVKVFLSVGFIRSIPSQEDVNAEQEKRRYSSMDAGWTVICNDRAVLYCDRSELTGWGEAGVPRYHTQFIAISGIVEFRSNDAAKLPTTTTKRGIDASSTLYLQVKNKMREGMQIFTNYTNKWKDNVSESKAHIESGKPHTLDEIKKEAKGLKLSSVKKGLKGKQFKPKVPLPKPEESTVKRISYSKELDDIQKVQEHLFGEEEVTPSKVGEECFDQMLKEAQQ